MRRGGHGHGRIKLATDEDEKPAKRIGFRQLWVYVATMWSRPVVAYGLGAAAPLLDRSLICALHCTVCSRLLKPYFWPSSLADRVRAFTCFGLLGMAKLCTLVPC